MNIADFIRLGNTAPPLRFLVVGGYAVAAHGYQRATFDVDFLAPKEDRELWETKANSAGLKKFAQTENFIQFTPEKGDAFDVMFVNSRTFEMMWGESQESIFDGATARVPNLEHLLALKLHALKSQPAHRTFKDADDVEVLLRRHGLDISQPRYEQFFLKYATREIYETFLRILRR